MAASFKSFSKNGGEELSIVGDPEIGEPKFYLKSWDDTLEPVLFKELK